MSERLPPATGASGFSCRSGQVGSFLAAALSAEDLFEQVWDENADPFTKTVQVTIGRLRRKLREPDIIESIPGVGYRITNKALRTR